MKFRSGQKVWLKSEQEIRRLHPLIYENATFWRYTEGLYGGTVSIKGVAAFRRDAYFIMENTHHFYDEDMFVDPLEEMVNLLDNG